MPVTEFRSAGVYGQETAPTRAQEGISPAKMGIVGWTEKGPVNDPKEVRSVEEFTSKFGAINSRGLVALCMRPFFGTGGERAWVNRVVPADALSAFVDIDAPAKWTFTANGAGEYGNAMYIRIEGNRNFLDRTAGAEAWTKFNLKVLEPSSTDPGVLIAAEQYEAIQFNDPLASDYIVAAMTDPRKPSELVIITVGVGGVPAGLLSSQLLDEIIGTGDLLGTQQFAGTLAQFPVISSTLRIVASEAQFSDIAQVVAPVPDGIATGFTCTIANAPLLDGSVQLYYARNTPVIAEDVTGSLVGLINGLNQDFQLPPLALSDKVHRENAVFQIRYADPVIPPTSVYSGAVGAGAPFDLASLGPSGPLLPAQTLPIHPGSVQITTTVGAVPATLIAYDDPTTIVGTIADIMDVVGPTKVGEIDYATGIITGPAGAPIALSITPPDPAAPVNFDALVSRIITKAAVAANDNMELGTALLGAIDGAGVNTIDHVNSLTAPTGNGLLDFRTQFAPPTGSLVFVDFVRLGIVASDVSGVLTGDVGVGTNTVDFTTGAVDVELAAPALLGETIDADSQQGQVVTDDGLGNLIGDVDAAGNNTIDYETGAFDVTFAAPPLNGTNILANYAKIAQYVDYQLAGGTNGTAVSRAEISDPSLEDAQEGIYAMDMVEDPLNMVVPDFEGSAYVQADLVDYCEARNTRFAVMCFANGTTKEEAQKYVLVDQAWDTKVAAIYWPNIYFVNESTDRPELIPNSPFIAGVYAKTALNKNVGKSPAGIDDGALDANGTVGPEFDREVNDKRVRDDLYQSRINPLFNSDATGFVVWGARSLSNEFRWRYVNARLLHNYLMDALTRELYWTVFENNGPALWVKVETALKGFMGSHFRLGYFAGVTEAQAFFVVCNISNNNQTTIDEGKVIIDVGFSPFKPAEFVIFRLSQPASTITV